MRDNKPLTTSWRRLAIATYAAPKDSRIYGTFDVDVTEVLKYIEAQRKAGNRLTITHFMAAALARTLYEDLPDVNCFVRRGHVVARRDANLFITINVGGGGMTGMILKRCQELSALEIGKLILSKSKEKRAGIEEGAFAARDKIANIPWPFRRPIFLFIKWWIFDMGLPFPFLKIPPDPFGSIMLTNIGTFGLQYGFPALFPIGRLPCVIAMGALTKKPVVIDNEIQIRDILPVGGTFDHRIMDGYQGGVLASGTIRRLQHPEELDQPNRQKSEAEK
ncbi:MAG: 2-oxo acid dehydrogenase subunit E2 [Candidatus Marinimicrobia bacterium]|nr:2-oxo acid dehydrogenase subunit E2 [Candidatus Neomarinimicrobiota bacterium]MCK9561019.1 2-oxo acid dehydrogenase subunit E2 [Candidatus Neomarinimicrobiota bacterium]MDD5061894.1 2-oxo acid dehydrogenase subunit E2 [Candidatus Neomarinimicrobiota bacterium]MDD5541359.1 2-oxo acid dehydrogenase subunit E2 [Candidatus Neomarinimicrobiota bacterium]